MRIMRAKFVLICALLVLTRCVPNTRPMPTPNPGIALTMTAMSDKLDPLSIRFMTENICNKPCLAGIIPGETTKAEAFEIILNPNGFENCEDVDVLIYCDNAIIEYDDNDQVESVDFDPESLNLGLVIERYGPPDTVIIISQYGSIGTTLWFHDLNMTVSLTALPNTTYPGEYTIEPKSGIYSISLYSRDIYEYAIGIYEQGIDIGENGWEGYGIYPETEIPDSDDGLII